MRVGREKCPSCDTNSTDESNRNRVESVLGFAAREKSREMGGRVNKKTKGIKGEKENEKKKVARSRCDFGIFPSEVIRPSARSGQ